jgi:hypothetical protein
MSSSVRIAARMGQGLERIYGVDPLVFLTYEVSMHMIVFIEDDKGIKRFFDVLERSYLSNRWEEIWRSLESIF